MRILAAWKVYVECFFINDFKLQKGERCGVQTNYIYILQAPCMGPLSHDIKPLEL